MNFNPNLSFNEIIIRYALLIGIGILAGVFQNFFLIIPAIGVFLTAILGWCPVKAMMSGNKKHIAFMQSCLTVVFSLSMPEKMVRHPTGHFILYEIAVICRHYGHILYS